VDPGGYEIPAATCRVEAVIERSRFIATLGAAPDVKAARAFLDAVRAEFPDATHNCWAYVAGAPGSAAATGMSDAGEPHGTAGRPMLDVLLHSGLGECVAVVTRYYGGTKLGKGGLVRAYAGAVQHALAELPRTRRVARSLLRIRFGYGDAAAVRRLIAQHDALVEEEQFSEEAEYRVAIPSAFVDAFRTALADATAGRGRVED
jgi:uncharacterized YigZ family protein